jgi:HPt (histidine-containing phosphotransfer) domain-containing protein
MQPLIRTFLQRLNSQVSEMERLVVTNRSLAALKRLCMEIKGSAGGYGYPGISRKAGELLAVLGGDADAQAIGQAFEGLRELCNSACWLLRDGDPLAAATCEQTGRTAPSAEPEEQTAARGARRGKDRGQRGDRRQRGVA